MIMLRVVNFTKKNYIIINFIEIWMQKIMFASLKSYEFRLIFFFCFFSIIAIPNGTNPSTPSQNGQNGNDEDGEVMNNLMSDIQNGFVHRRLPDGGFKVRIIIIIIFLHLSD